MNTRRILIPITTFLLIGILPEFALCRSPYADDNVGGTMLQPSFYQPHDDCRRLPKQQYAKPEAEKKKPFVLRDPFLSKLYTPPPNDNFVNRITVVGNNTSVNGNNISATVEPGEPELHKERGSNSVWWTWTPTASGTCTIDTDGSSFDTYLAVYSGSAINDLYEIASDDDGGEVLNSKVIFILNPGQTYQVAVFGYSPANEGSITLNFNVLPPPPNDNFADAIAIYNASGMSTGVNFSATTESGERPITSFGNGRNSVWWKWTAPTDGIHGFDTFGSNFDTVLGIFSGSSLDTLERLDWNDDTGSLRSYVHVNARAGATYYISVAGFGDASLGSITLNWRPDQIFWYYTPVDQYDWTNVSCAADGSILVYKGHQTTTEYTGSNLFGSTVRTSSNTYNFYDFTVKDKNKKEVVNTPVLDTALTGNYSVLCFDGKQLLVYQRQDAYGASGTLLLYKISKKEFSQAGHYSVARNFHYATLKKTHVELQQNDWGTPLWHVSGLHRRLKKPLWTTTSLTNGWLFPVSDKGVVASYVFQTNVLHIKVTKKDKPYGRHVLPASSFRINDKGSIIYWTQTPTGAGPLTLINRAGKILDDNFLLNNMTNFGYCWFDGKLFYLRKTVDLTNTTIRTYTVTSSFKLNGDKTNIMNYIGAHINRGKAYVVLQSAGDDMTMLEYTKKLDKPAWENTGPTHAYTVYGNATFCRIYQPSPGQTTYTVFKRDKDIVTHEYPEP